ncbi:CTLH/CRA C-terminal to lish motif domain-containing protein [Mycena rosella]|uniref:CTLH/CRA C-terminal to lish motif domain-containing protein n=1 Tax=Mycena rosella TaxID=1033263 RepID=A0AAD7H1K5_MYCRO|nr:CTLH/CRA C-terminal to lish motif domain-containing protein [Mycena rosella]
MLRDLQPTPYQLRALVIDYLVHHGYSSTARAFAQGSMVPTSLDADGDEIMQPADTPESSGALGVSEETFLQVDLRQRIRAHILIGQVSSAIELLEQHFPAVLSSEALPSAPEPHKSLMGTDFVASTTVNPAHLNLNLRILAFTEAFRTAPLDRVLAAAGSSPLEDEDDPITIELLAKARKLQALVFMLPNSTERAAYSQELRNVAGLLAYPDPQSSPVAKYLSQERREAVANQINTAILYRTGFPAISHLELSTRYTSTLWSFLHDFHVKPRPGGPLPPTSIDKVASPSLKGAKTADTDASEVPRFDLQQFLNSKA